jgi:hypothetical protein
MIHAAMIAQEKKYYEKAKELFTEVN